jgi:hypothetical protein
MERDMIRKTEQEQKRLHRELEKRMKLKRQKQMEMIRREQEEEENRKKLDAEEKRKQQEEQHDIPDRASIEGRLRELSKARQALLPSLNKMSIYERVQRFARQGIAYLPKGDKVRCKYCKETLEETDTLSLIRHCASHKSKPLKSNLVVSPAAAPVTSPAAVNVPLLNIPVSVTYPMCNAKTTFTEPTFVEVKSTPFLQSPIESLVDPLEICEEDIKGMS